MDAERAKTYACNAHQSSQHIYQPLMMDDEIVTAVFCPCPIP